MAFFTKHDTHRYGSLIMVSGAQLQVAYFLASLLSSLQSYSGFSFANLSHLHPFLDLQYFFMIKFFTIPLSGEIQERRAHGEIHPCSSLTSTAACNLYSTSINWIYLK